MKAVVLAAGEGQRLRPLTFTRPKHMIPVGGKSILEHLINALRASGIEEILLVVNYKAEMIKNYFGNGEKFKVKIKYILQRKILGTADAVAAVEKYVNDEYFLAINGDLLLSTNAIKTVLKTHEENKPTITLAAVQVDNPEHYGVLEINGGHVINILEKPPSGIISRGWVNAGIYVFSSAIFDFIRRTKPSVRDELEITDSILLAIREGETVLSANLSNEEWLDIGKPWDLLDANMRVLKMIKQCCLGTIEEGAYIKGAVYIGENSLIRSGSYIEGPVYIGDESDIGPNCYIRPYTSIGRNVRIGSFCEVKNSIIMDNVRIAHLSYVGDSVIGEGCNLGAGTISANLRFNGKTIKMMVKDELVDTGKKKIGVIMGDNVMTGVGTLFMPGVKIGNNSWIGPNIVVYRDVPPNTILILEQQIKPIGGSMH